MYTINADEDIRAQTSNLLASRSVTAASVPGITTVMDETLQWRADSKLENYSVDRFGAGVWNESRDYIYNARGQLISESYAPAASEVAKVSYNFDEDKLGVLTRAETYGDVASSWAIPDGQLDGFARMLQEATYGTKTIPAHGLAEGARSVEIALYDGAVKRPLDASFSGEANDWKWEVDLELGAGDYELGIKANHPSGAYKSEEVRSAFTVTGDADQLIDITYDEAGYTQTRTFGDGRSETFYWDCAGRLLRIESRDTTSDGYDFECVYDAYGRRLKTIQAPVLADVAQVAGIITETCYYDPQIEFLSLMVAINGDRQWKVHGPDLNGSYGALQGIGGIEAVYQESSTQWHAAINDRFGNVLASIEESGADDALTLSDSRVGGYGAMTGGQLKTLGLSDTPTESTSLIETLSWRSHRLDFTGYICMGDRYYDPVSGRFLSPDPYGHGASMDLYSFAGGDPINFVDPTGRFYEGYWGDVGGTLLNMPGTLVTAADGALDFGSGIMAAPFDSDVSGEFFQDSQDKSFSGQVYEHGGSHQDAQIAAGAIGTSFVASTVIGGKIAADIVSGAATVVISSEDLVPEPSPEPMPPVYDPEDPRWEKGPSSRDSNRGIPRESGGAGSESEATGAESWWHPEHGEWRRHEDKHHDPHWDNNSWDGPHDKWRNVDDDGQETFPWGNTPTYPPSADVNGSIDPISGRNPTKCP